MYTCIKIFHGADGLWKIHGTKLNRPDWAVLFAGTTYRCAVERAKELKSRYPDVIVIDRNGSILPCGRA